MTNRRRFGVLAGVLCALDVAGLLWIRHEALGRSRPWIRVVSALPTRNVDQTDRFSLLFDLPVAAADVVGRPVDRSPFVIDPQPDGRWVWSQPNRLDYVLNKPLAPGRVFTIKSASDIELQTGRALVGESTFRFKTRSLQLSSCRVGTADRNNVTLELVFNQRVVPDDLLRHLKLHDPSKWQWLAPACLTREPAEKVTVRCSRPKSGRLRVLIEAALTGSGGKLALGEQVVRELQMPEVFALLRAGLHEPGLEKDVCVDLEFSEPIDREQSLPEVRVTPAVAGIRVRFGEDRLTLEGPFECGKRYTATVSRNLLSMGRKPLGEDQAVSFDVPDREPAVQFPVQRGILGPGGNLTVDVKAVNVAGLTLNAARLHANNLCAHLRGDRKGATSRELPKKTIHLDLARNVPATLALDLRELVGEPLGVYSVEAEASDHRWTDDSVVVAVTDLAMLAKAEREGFLVWVTSLRTARPLAAVEVSALTFNGQTLATAITDARGIARLQIPNGHPDGEAWLITARSDDDLSFLRPGEQSWVVDNVDQSGRDIPTTYDVMLYSERGVYRPGDTIHLTGIIRDVLGRVPPPFRLAVTARRPDGREVAQMPVTWPADQQGMFHLDYATNDDGRTGSYRFAASLPGAKEVLGRTEALVEEYVPARLQVTAEPVLPRFGPNDEIALRVAGRYLFDQPAAGLPVTIMGTYRRMPFQSKQFVTYRFDTSDDSKEVAIPETAQELDAEGRFQVSFDRPEGDVPGLWRLDVTATVTEAGGRSVSQAVEGLVDTSDRHVGLRLPAGRMVPAGSPAQVDWVQATGADELAEPGPMAFTLSRVDYDTTLEEVDGRMVWKSVERLTTMTEGEVENTPGGGGKGAFTVTCPAAAHYRLRVVDCFSGAVTQAEFDATDEYGAGYALSLNRPEQVELVLDREAYSPGSVARVLVKSPFPGTLLLTVETDRVIDQQVLELAANSVEVDLPVDDTLRGGAFINATVIRPVDPAESTWLPHRAMGMARLATDHSRHELPVTIAAPKQAQPRQAVSVTVQAPAPSDASSPPVVHLWAVDEGILLTTAYDTPDPLAYFFALRRAGVTSSDVFGDLLPDHRRPASMTRIGGDGSDEAAEKLRRSSVPARRRAAAVIWRKTVPLGADGAVTAELAMPDLVGEMRLMAVVVDRDRYGSAEHALTLTSPLLVETSWPRFAAPNDRFDVPAKLFNSTNEPLTVNLNVRTEGPVIAAPTETALGVVVRPGEPVTAWLHMTSTGIGQARVRVEASAASVSGQTLTAMAEADFPVRPAGPLHAESRLFRVKAGEPFKLEPSSTFLPGTARTTLSVSSRPSLHLQPALEQLIGYPYGCVEQTTSRLFALMHAPDLLKSEGPADSRPRSIADMIDAGISRLWSMQTRSGGLSYWPDGSTPDLWGTAYAAEFLIQAQRAGRKVDGKFVEEIAKYLQGELNHHSDEPLDDNMRAQLCYVLSACKHPQHGWLARLSDQLDQLDVDGRAHVAAAWLELGRKDRAAAVLTGDLLAQRVATTTGARLTSQVRQEAVLLGVLLDLDRGHPWIPAIVERLEKARRNGQWGSTLENASVLAVLARYQALGQSEAAFRGTLRGGLGEPRPFDHRSKLSVECRDDRPIEIESSGQGDIYVSATTQGLLRQRGAIDYDHRLRVSRRWIDRQGRAINPARLRVGDLVLVETALELIARDEAQSVDNVAVVDALPGGMEVENPRLATSAQPQDDDEPDRVEFRDDRVVLFASASREKSVFRYALRAVTAGSFDLPPIQASCMYDSGFASVHAGGRVEIAR